VSHTILLVDDDKEFCESIGELLRDEGYDTLLAGSAPKALEHASRHKLSLCLLDVALPGVDGIQLLRYFRSRHVFRLMPVVLLTAGISKDAVRQALQLGVKDILLKSRFSTQELLDRVHKRITGPVEVVRNPEMAPSSVDSSAKGRNSHFDNPPSRQGGEDTQAPSGFDSTLEFDRHPESASDAKKEDGGRELRQVTKEMIQAVGGLRALPGIVETLVAVASNPEASLSDLEEVVRRDPVVAARIVQISNSAAYMRGGPVSRLDEALRVLGFSNVVRVASTGAVLRREDLEGDAGDDLAMLWCNSLATGAISERLATKPEKPGAFLRGLLHEIPSIFALQYLGSDWLPWRSHAMVKGWPLRESLSCALGCPLEGLAGQILAAYRIPAEVATPIQEFYEFFLATHPREPGASARLLEVSRLFATSLGRPGTILSEVRGIHRDEVKGLDLGVLTATDMEEDIKILEMSAGLGARLQDLPKHRQSVVLWRDGRWIAPDPVESILARCMDCLRVDRFEELSGPPGRVRVAMAEPGSLEWERLASVAPVIALHRGSLRPGPLPAGVEAIRMPDPIHHLLHRIDKLAG